MKQVFRLSIQFVLAFLVSLGLMVFTGIGHAAGQEQFGVTETAAVKNIDQGTAAQISIFPQPKTREPFFQPGIATKMFDPSVKATTDSFIEFFPRARPKKLVALTNTPVNSSGQPQSESLPAQPRTSEEVIASYGDPSLPKPVLAKEEAPTPFKGIYAALAVGDKALALQYAKQYARYMQDLKNQNNYVVGLIGKGMVGEGVVTNEDWPGAPQYADQEKLLKADLAKRGILNEIIPSQFNEATERSKAREDLSLTAPIARDGKIDLYFFLDLKDEKSLKQARELDRLNLKVRDDTRINLIGFVQNSATPKEIEEYLKVNDLSINLQPGDVIAQSMKVRSAPTILITEPGNHKTISLPGFQSSYYLEEALNIMQGRESGSDSASQKRSAGI